MRSKTELKQRDGYACMFAALRITRMIAEKLVSPDRRKSIRVEDETTAEVDDVIESEEMDDHILRRCFQVKRQYTALDKGKVSRVLRMLSDNSIAEVSLVVPAPIDVVDASNLRFLKSVVDRAAQTGADYAEIAVSARPDEQTWIDLTRSELHLGSDVDAVRLFARLRVMFVGDEAALRESIRERLELYYKQPVDLLIEGLVSYALTVDGTTNTTFDVIHDKVLRHHQRLVPADFADVYASTLATIEDRLWLFKWRSVTDTLVRDLLPREFSEDIAELRLLFEVLVWPGQHLELESAMKNVVVRAGAYVDCFHENSEEAGSKLFRENLAYKRRFNAEAYATGRVRSDQWSVECFKRLANLVVALNELASITRQTINPKYRLIEGKFFIEDSLGFRNNADPAVYRPDSYRETSDSWKLAN
jgi:hypothetical protein